MKQDDQTLALVILAILVVAGLVLLEKYTGFIFEENIIERQVEVEQQVPRNETKIKEPVVPSRQKPEQGGPTQEAPRNSKAGPEGQLQEAQPKQEQGDSSEEETTLTKVFNVLNETYNHVVAWVWFQSGKFAKDRTDYQSALEYFETAVRLAPDYSIYINEAGMVAHLQGQYDKAIGYYKRALAINLKTFGPDHPGVAIDWYNLGSAWRARGDYDQAIEYLEKAREIWAKAGLDHMVTRVDENLAAARKEKGQQ